MIRRAGNALVTDAADLERMLLGHRAGDVIDLQIERSGDQREPAAEDRRPVARAPYAGPPHAARRRRRETADDRRTTRSRSGSGTWSECGCRRSPPATPLEGQPYKADSW